MDDTTIFTQIFYSILSVLPLPHFFICLESALKLQGVRTPGSILPSRIPYKSEPFRPSTISPPSQHRHLKINVICIVLNPLVQEWRNRGPIHSLCSQGSGYTFSSPTRGVLVIVSVTRKPLVVLFSKDPKIHHIHGWQKCKVG